MPRTVYYVASSLDGFIADEQDKLEWLFQFNDADGVEDSYKEFMAGIGALVMGSETYKFILDSGGADAWEYGDTPAWVYTHHELPGIPGADITFVRGDISLFHQNVAADAGDRDVWVIGGGEVAAQYLDAGLLDELIVTFVPVVLGRGKRLLPVTTTTAPAELTGSRTLGAGMVELRYRFGKE
ncbi:dihydrofolate reductase [Arthrobacter crystallopoietes BAB-32]|uniref:Dihydrofolate reductase n=1 Tax=Arthrobacter crystallopoietes BAB-32 TaxID=1246476 RepID=N1VC78_9MICC|nr:dihydrofolate reductase family protein [Arthrobacter crystallopoietes]EMY35888.1 dihydrofolate reductase [Arthrobacter crystallopoietes BAB-32]